MGWFGFNGGSALQAGPVAVSALISTQIGCATSAFAWLCLTWKAGKPSATGIMNGALAGLAGITPASGYISTQWSILLGFIFGIVSFYGIHLAKHKWRLDDALDVNMVHGLTGIVGSLAVGLFASEDHSGIVGANGAFYGHGMQFVYQLVGVLLAGAWAGFWTWLIIKVLTLIYGPLRVTEREENIGLDWVEHGEVAYHKLHVLNTKMAPLFNPSAAQLMGSGGNGHAISHSSHEPDALHSSLLATHSYASSGALVVPHHPPSGHRDSLPDNEAYKEHAHGGGSDHHHIPVTLHSASPLTSKSGSSASPAPNSIA